MTRAARILGFALATTLSASALAAQVVPPPPPEPPPPPGWIGVSYETRKAQEGLRIRVVSEVMAVVEGSPAAGAGIRPGDILVSVNGKAWEEEYGKGAPRLRAGDPVRLVVERGGRQQELRLVAGTRPAKGLEANAFKVTVMPDSVVDRLYVAMDSLRVRMVEFDGLRFRLAELGVEADSVLRDLERTSVVRLRRPVRDQGVAVSAPTVAIHGMTSPAAPFGFRIVGDSTSDSLTIVAEWGAPFPLATLEPAPDAPFFRPTVPYVLGENRVAGAELIELRAELAGYFGVPGGILVVDVTEGTPAARAGLLPGDVLVEMDGAPLASITDLRRGLAAPGPDARVTVVRKGKPLAVVLRR